MIKYFLAVKTDDGTKIFLFKSKERRQRMIEELDKVQVEYATAEDEEPTFH